MKPTAEDRQEHPAHPARPAHPERSAHQEHPAHPARSPRPSRPPRRRPLHRTLLAPVVLTVAALTATACGSSEPASLFADGRVSVGAKNDQPGTGVVHKYKFSGFDISVTQQILGEVGVEPDFGIVPSEDRTAVLTDKKKDLVAATFSITTDRMKELDFAGPYAATFQGIMVRTKDNRVHRYEDLFGKRVCTWPGTTSKITLDKQGDQRIAVNEREDAASCISALRNKQADAVSTDQMILYGITQENPDFEVIPGITLGSANQYGIAMAKGHREDCLRLRDALRKYVTSNSWSHDFSTSLPSIPKADTTWETDYKPRVETIDALSCRDEPKT